MRTLIPNPKKAKVPEGPYRGIEAFRYVDQAIFFARDLEIEEALRYVTLYRAVALYGESGTGKSSLVNAGLIPAAENYGYAPERIRVQPDAGREFVVERIATGRTGKEAYLDSIFATRGEKEPRVVLSTSEFVETVRSTAKKTPRSLLVFDQFEELVTLFEEAARDREGVDPKAARRSVVEVLCALARDQSVPLKLLFVFREDYLAKILRLFELLPELRDNYMRLTPPATEDLYEIIRGPFDHHHYDKELSPALARRLVDELVRRSESDEVNLSELQIVCVKLWTADDPEKAFEERKIEGLLEDYMADALDELSPDLNYPAVAVLSRLITASGSRNVVSEEDLVERVSREENIPEGKLKDVLGALEKARLIRRERRHKAHFYEIVSEFLVPWIIRERDRRLLEQQMSELIQNVGAQELHYYRKAFTMFRLSRWSTIGMIVVGALAAFALIGNYAGFWEIDSSWLVALIILPIWAGGAFRSFFGQRAEDYQRAATSAAMQRQAISRFGGEESGLTGEQWVDLREELDELAATSIRGEKQPV